MQHLIDVLGGVGDDVGNAASGLYNISYRVPGFWASAAGSTARRRLLAVHDALWPSANALNRYSGASTTAENVLRGYIEDLDTALAEVELQRQDLAGVLERYGLRADHVLHYPADQRDTRFAEVERWLTAEEDRIRWDNVGTRNRFPAAVEARATQLRAVLGVPPLPEPPGPPPEDPGLDLDPVEITMTAGQIAHAADTVQAAVTADLAALPGPKEEPLAAVFGQVMGTLHQGVQPLPAELRDISAGFIAAADVYGSSEAKAQRAIAAR